MSLSRRRYAASRRLGLLGVLFSALLALTLFPPSVATAQEVKQIKLNEKHMQGFIAVSEDMAKLSDGANQDKLDAELEAQADALVKRNGFANLAEFDDVSTNISMIMSGIDPQTKKFTEPPEQIKQQIAAVKADKSVPEAQKREDFAQLEAALKGQSPFGSRKTLRWC